MALTYTTGQLVLKPPLWIQSPKDNLWYWVDLPTGVEHDVVLEFVVDQLASAGDTLAEEQSNSG